MNKLNERKKKEEKINIFKTIKRVKGAIFKVFTWQINEKKQNKWLKKSE